MGINIDILKYVAEWERAHPVEFLPGMQDMQIEKSALDCIASNDHGCGFKDGKLHYSGAWNYGDNVSSLTFYHDKEFDYELAFSLVKALLNQIHEEMLESGIGDDGNDMTTFVGHDLMSDVRTKLETIQLLINHEIRI